MREGTMDGMVVQKGAFPYGRKASCCKHALKVGESVLVVPWRYDRQDQIVLHKRCLERLLAMMPDDVSLTAQRFQDLRDRIIETGEAFPKRKRRAG